VFVVSDGDASQLAENEKVAKDVKAVKEAAGDRLFQFQEDVEQALETTKKKPNLPHVVAVAQALDFNSIPDDHEIARLRAALLAFLNADYAVEDGE
jgi:hypothetical protein